MLFRKCILLLSLRTELQSCVIGLVPCTRKFSQLKSKSVFSQFFQGCKLLDTIVFVNPKPYKRKPLMVWSSKLQLYYTWRTHCCCTKKQRLLPSSVSQSTINCFNGELNNATHSQAGKKCSEYVKLEDDDKATVDENAAKHGTAATMRHFKANERFLNLKEATVRWWKNAYLQAVQKAQEALF